MSRDEFDDDELAFFEMLLERCPPSEPDTLALSKVIIAGKVCTMIVVGNDRTGFRPSLVLMNDDLCAMATNLDGTTLYKNKQH